MKRADIAVWVQIVFSSSSLSWAFALEPVYLCRKRLCTSLHLPLPRFKVKSGFVCLYLVAGLDAFSKHPNIDPNISRVLWAPNIELCPKITDFFSLFFGSLDRLCKWFTEYHWIIERKPVVKKPVVSPCGLITGPYFALLTFLHYSSSIHKCIKLD